eukprot:6378400-Prorocentrum_lima.AAC.1
MTSSLVGSEMCIRDRICILCRTMADGFGFSLSRETSKGIPKVQDTTGWCCLLYTSDAADDM